MILIFMVFVAVAVCYIINIFENPKTIEETMMFYNQGKPLTEYKHTVREVVYDVDVNGDGKYDATYKWIRNNK